MKKSSLQFGKAMSAALFVLLLSVVGMTKSYAYDFSAVCETGQTLYYNITDATNHYVSLTYPGGYSWNGWSGFAKPTGDIILPSAVDYEGVTYTVTSIGSYAFLGCSDLTGNLTIPNSVTSIGSYAFEYCSGLTGDLIIPNSVISIGSSAFRDCTSLTSIEIPNSVTTISDMAFFHCTGLTGNLTIGNSVTSIGNSAFSNCSGLTGSLTIGNSVTSIGNSAFSNCSGLTGSLTIPNSLTSIGNSAFEYCSGLTGSLTIGNSVTSIGDDAFYGCSGLTGNLTIGNSVTSIGDSAFHGCSGLTSLTIPNSVTSIGDGAFHNCSGLTGSLTIGNSVTSIGSWAFGDCSGLTSLTIPNSVTSIGSWAFWLCSGLTSLTIPNSVTSIGDSAFNGCSGLTSLDLGNSLTSIGNGAFGGCWGLEQIIVDEDNPSYDSRENCNAIIETGTNTLIIGCKNTIIPNSVTSIGNSAFYNRSGLTGSLTIPNSVTSIGNSAFKYCSGLTSLTIPNSVTSIGDYAFEYCSGLTSMTLGNSVTSIGDYAFQYCSGLSTITVLAETPPTLGYKVFYYIDTSIPVYVPCSSITDYQSSAGWIEFTNYQSATICASGEITVTVNPTESGTVTGTGYYEGGTLCTLTATPNEGYLFLNWSKNGEVISTYSTYSFIVAGDADLVANFVEGGDVCFITFELYDSYGDGYTGNYLVVTDESESQQLTVESGSSALYTLPFASGSHLTLTWIVGSYPGDCSFTASYSNGNVFYNGTNLSSNFYYEFDVDCDGLFDIIAEAVPSEGGQVYGAGQYEYNDTCTLIAEANEGYTFLNWSENGNQVSLETNYSFTVTSDRTLVANFVEGDVCVISFELYDSYGDGYTGNYLVVTDENGSQQLTVESGFSAVYTLSFLKGNHITLTWIVGSYPAECSFTVRNSDGIVIYNGTNLSSNFNYGFDVDCNSAPIENIVFADPNVKAICLANWDTNGDGELSYDEAAAVTNLGEVFESNGTITSFDELQYFTGLTTIGSYAFYGCYGLTSITIPNSVTVIDQYAFANCYYLTSVELPNSLITIGYSAFYNCFQLIFITLPNTVTTIGGWAFSHCYKLTLMEIPASVTSIGSYAFFSCYGLVSIEIPASVTSIGNSAFCICTGLEQITVAEENTFFDSRDNCNAIIETASNTLRFGCKNSLIPNTVMALGDEAFYHMDIPSVDIPESVESIGTNVFGGCPMLEQITVAEGNSTFDSRDNCNAVVETGTNKLVFGCKNTVIPNTVTTIGQYAFYNCNSLTSIVIPNSVTAIDQYAFAFCYNLTSMELSNSLITIGYSAFSDCHQVNSIILPNTVTTIGGWAFSYCSGLTSLEIPASVTSISNYAFSYCTGLTSITSLAQNLPALGNNVFKDVDKSIPVYVPCISIYAYQNASGWDEFTNITSSTVCNSGEIIVTANPAVGGTVTGGGNYEGGAFCALIATANVGYSFLYWTENGIIVSYDATCSFTVDGDRALVANFVEEGAVCVLVFDLYDSFGDGWTGNFLVIDCGDGNTEHLTIEGGSSATYNRLIATGSHINLTWIIGDWPEDCSFTIRYEDGDLIYENDYIESNFEYSFDVDCSGGNSVTQTISLARGWNWYSTYIEQEGIDGLGQLENSIGVPKAIIQSQGDGYVKSVLRNGRILWGGALSSINNEEMYKIGTKYICEATMEGVVTNPANHPITINKGWNWIGFPCDHSVSVTEALSGFTPRNKDVIKGLNSYATYRNGTWVGTLNTLEPGQGYMYGSGNNAPKTLIFQTGRGEATLANITPENNFYQPTDDFADNMTLTAVIELDGEELRSEDYELAAFVGDECRGSVKLMYVESLNRYVAFLTVFGDETEDLHFVLTDGIDMSQSEDYVPYETDGMLGSITEPVTLRFGTLGVGDSMRLPVHIYPNPSKDVFNIEGVGIRKVEVTNAFGQVILSEEVESDNLQINLSGNAAGAYLLRVVTDWGVTTKKLVKE